MSDGSDVEYGKKEFFILKLPDFVTSARLLFSQILLNTTCEQGASFTCWFPEGHGVLLVLLARLSNLKWLSISACDQGWNVRIPGALSAV